jgi:hypothetical protein
MEPLRCNHQSSYPGRMNRITPVEEAPPQGSASSSARGTDLFGKLDLWHLRTASLLSLTGDGPAPPQQQSKAFLAIRFAPLSGDCTQHSVGILH